MFRFILGCNWVKQQNLFMWSFIIHLLMISLVSVVIWILNMIIIKIFIDISNCSHNHWNTICNLKKSGEILITRESILFYSRIEFSFLVEKCVTLRIIITIHIDVWRQHEIFCPTQKTLIPEKQWPGATERNCHSLPGWF